MTSELLDTVLAIAAVPITTMLTGMMWKVYLHFDKSATAQDKANMEAEIQAALGAGIAAAQKTMPLVMSQGIRSPAVRDMILAEATKYFRVRFPERTGQIINTVSGTGQQPNAAVQQTLDARLANINLAPPAVAAPGGVASGSEPRAATTLPGIPLGRDLPP